MSTRGVAHRKWWGKRPAAKPQDAKASDIGVASRPLVLAALEATQAELTDITLTRSERKEVITRINRLRNLLGLPAQ